MSQSAIVQRKSSPCCIGCVVLVVVVFGIFAALGIWGYRFYKDNIGIHDVTQIADPSLDVKPEVMFPATVGAFTRESLNEPLSGTPYEPLSKDPQLDTGGLETSSVITARYSDAEQNIINAVAISTEAAQNLRKDETGPLTMGRGKANAPNVAISLKNPLDKQSTTLTWSKSNWTVMLHTTSTVIVKFLDDYKSVAGDSIEGDSPAVNASNAETTGTSSDASNQTPVAVEPTEVPSDITPTGTPETAPTEPVPTPDAVPQEESVETTAPAQ